MKYQCNNPNCKKSFLHTAQLTNYGKDHELIETNVCPFCQSKEYTEFVEPAEEISSVKSVDLAQVDDYLKLGYKVKELHAKTATLVKMETAPKDANLTLKDVIKAGIEQAKQEAPQ